MATIQEQGSRWSRLMGTVGFKKTYNFILWFIVSGALLGFILARSPYLDFNVFCHSGPGSELGASPGECYYYVNFDRYYIGIRMHLISITTASFLAILQFVPIIRYKALLFHRISGYLVFLGILFAHIGSLMIANIAFGGGVAVTTWIGILALCTTIFVVLAWINIKRLQIDQHRAWMLRAWFYLSAIVTQPILLAMMAAVLTGRGYYYAMPCAKIASIYPDSQQQEVQGLYPGCAAFFDGTNPTISVAVLGDKYSGQPEQTAALLDNLFGAALWIALAVHAAGIEIYLHLTPAESARLRQVSYERQLARQFKNPGNAGLTVQRFGDAEPWIPKSEQNATVIVPVVMNGKNSAITFESSRRSSDTSSDPGPLWS